MAERGELAPLPDDYFTLTTAGQRQARVAAIKKQHTPEDLVMAWTFLRSYYLAQGESGWYQPPTYESPACHYRFVDNVARYSRNCLVYPRSYAKSYISDELLMTWCLGRGRWSVLNVLSRDDLVRYRFLKIMRQLTHNQRILADFGSLRPKRGEGVWSSTRLWLNNGFQLIGRSIGGQLLGPRTNFVMIDDAEYDPVLHDCPTDKTDQLRQLYYNHILPIVEAGGGVLLTGTLFRKRTFIYTVATTPIEEDPSMAYWNREVWAIYDGSPSNPTWPSKFPTERILQLMDEYPPAAFAAQFLNEPASDDARPLRIHPDFAWYTVDEPDEAYWNQPLKSQCNLVTWVKASEESEDDSAQKVVRPFAEVVQGMYRIIVADPIRKPSSTSDFACVMVVGIENTEYHRDTWYVLDMKLGRPKETQFLEWIWQLGEKWMPRVVGVEAIGAQKSITEAAVSMYDVRSAESGWAPRVFPITYKGEMSGDRGKGRRISAMAWRFDYNKVKFPRHLQKKPEYAMLMEQARDFTGDLALLRYDDAIDTLAMPQFVVKPLGSQPVMDIAPKTIGELLESGEYYLPERMMGQRVPIIFAIDPSKLTSDQMRGLDMARYREQKRRQRDRDRRRLARSPRSRLGSIKSIGSSS